jgi:hypothetical protein
MFTVKQELDDLHNVVGTELAGSRGESKVLNGAVLMFDKGSRFVYESMVRAGTSTIQHYTIQYNTIQYDTIQYNTIQYNTIQIQHNTIQYNTIQHNLQRG